MADYIPNSDGDFRTWLNSFVTNCSTYSTILNLSVADLAAISTSADAFVAALDARDLAANAAKAATSDKDGARAATTATIRAFVREFQANPNVTNNIRGQLGITIPDDTRTNTPPDVPTQLTAFGCSNGINQLSWNRNGNIPNTQFIIEAKYGNSTTWDFVDVSTKSTYDHSGQVPGQTVYYRVWAKRSTLKSGYSNEAVVYADGGSGTTTLQVAA